MQVNVQLKPLILCVRVVCNPPATNTVLQRKMRVIRKHNGFALTKLLILCFCSFIHGVQQNGYLSQLTWGVIYCLHDFLSAHSRIHNVG
jgi:hypothetical protein